MSIENWLILERMIFSLEKVLRFIYSGTFLEVVGGQKGFNKWKSGAIKLVIDFP